MGHFKTHASNLNELPLSALYVNSGTFFHDRFAKLAEGFMEKCCSATPPTGVARDLFRASPTSLIPPYKEAFSSPTFPFAKQILRMPGMFDYRICWHIPNQNYGSFGRIKASFIIK
jgi:hypothetical protein